MDEKTSQQIVAEFFAKAVKNNTESTASPSSGKIRECISARVDALDEHFDLYDYIEEIVEVHRRLRGQYGLSPDTAMQVASTALLAMRIDGVKEEIGDVIDGLLVIKRQIEKKS